MSENLINFLEKIKCFIESKRKSKPCFKSENDFPTVK